MARLLLKNIPLRPELSVKSSDSPKQTHVVSGYSSFNSAYDQDLSPRSTTHTGSTASDSESDSLQSVYSSSTADSEEEVLHPLPSTPRITLKLDDQQAAKDKSTHQSHEKRASMAKSTRKRDKIRSTFHRSKNSTSTDGDENDANQWGEMLAKTLVSMHQDITEIIAGFDRLEQLPPEDSHSDVAAPVLTNPRLSFHERQSAKNEMVRMAIMLHPPNLLTCQRNECPYAYTDIVEPHGFHLSKMLKQLPGEHLLVQHKPLQHRKLLYRSQRGLSSIQRDLRKFKRDLFGKTSLRTHKELPSLYVQNYRNRLEKTLLDVRRQIAEYDQIHAQSDKRKQSISQVIAKMGPVDSEMQACMEDYRSKSRPIGFVDKKPRHQLISAPFISRRRRRRNQAETKPAADVNPQVVDVRFDPSTFVDLQQEAELFFGSTMPFWNRSTDLLSLLKSNRSSPISTDKKRSSQWKFPLKLGLWTRLVGPSEQRSNNIRQRSSHAIERSPAAPSYQASDQLDEYYDCSSSILPAKASPSLTNRRSSRCSRPIIVDASESVDF